MSKYILVDEYLNGELKGKPKYFREMTSIGPRSTPNVKEAFKFDNEEEARQSPAHRHWSANWTIKEVDE